jgi:hypothetical protein
VLSSPEIHSTFSKSLEWIIAKYSQRLINISSQFLTGFVLPLKVKDFISLSAYVSAFLTDFLGGIIEKFDAGLSSILGTSMILGGGAAMAAGRLVINHLSKFFSKNRSIILASILVAK